MDGVGWCVWPRDTQVVAQQGSGVTGQKKEYGQALLCSLLDRLQGKLQQYPGYETHW